MQKTYWIQSADLTADSGVELDEREYEELRSARLTLLDAGAFEQKYELLISNYREFEVHCASQSLVAMTSSDHSYIAASVSLTEANRLFMNFLTAQKSYVDQVVQDFKHVDVAAPLRAAGIEAAIDFQSLAKTRINAAYDDCAAYRVVCALRNHAQHSSPPIHGVRSQRNTCWAEASVFYSVKSTLAQNTSFKKKVLAELDEQVDIRTIAKRAVEQLSAVHVDLRRAVEGACRDARKLIQGAHEEISNTLREGGGTVIALWLCARVGSNDVAREVLLLQWDDTRLSLAHKNREPIKCIRI